MLKIVVWACQLCSITFLLYSTIKIRKIILTSNAISQLLDRRMIFTMLVLVSIFVICYIVVYCLLCFELLDPNQFVFYKSSGQFTEYFVSTYLVIQFGLQLGMLTVFKRLGTNLNTDADSNRMSMQIGYGVAQQDPGNYNESQLLEAAMKVSVCH